MSTFARHLRALTSSLTPTSGARAASSGVTFCDGCSEVCTTECRSDSHLDRARTRALAVAPIR